MDKIKVSVIIVNYNVRHYLCQCLDSLRRSLDGISSEVIVVDNHSHDDSVKCLQPLFPEVRFISSRRNLGFARANNIAIRQSRGEYVLLLNPDTIVGEHTIAESIAFMDSHADAGALGVKMLRIDGSAALESRRGIPSPMVAFYKMCGLCSRFPRSRRFGHYYMGYLPWNQPCRIEVVSGAYFFLRKAALDGVGVLDEDFFMYGEDIDLSFRILKSGYHNYYIPSQILHYKGESTEKSSFRYVHVFYEAMLIFFRKHYGHLNFLLSLPIKIAIFGKACVALVKMQAGRVRKMLGFYRRRKRVNIHYVMLVGKESESLCRRIIADNGLDAEVHVVDGALLSEGHHVLNLPFDDGLTSVVYDTGVYAFGQILSFMARSPQPNVNIGTFSPKNKIIITSEEIFQ